MIRIIKSIRESNFLSILVIVIVHLSITIPLSAYLNIWEDEAYSLNTSSQGIVYAWNQSIGFEAQPPVYFITLSIWRTFSSSIFFARLLSIVFSVISISLIYFLARKYITAKYYFFIALLFAVNPFLIWASTEMRVFGMVIMFSALLLFLFLKTYFDEKVKVTNRLLFIVIAVLGINSQYFVGFLLFGLGVALFFTKGIKRFFVYALDMVVPLITILYFLKAILQQVSVHEAIHPVENHLSLLDFVKFWPIRMFDYSLTFNLTEMAIGFWIFRGLIVFLFLITLVKSFQTIKSNFIQTDYSIFITTLIIILFFSGVYFTLGTEYVSEKYTAVLFPPFMVAFFILLVRLIQPKFVKIWLFIILFLMLSSSIVKFSGLVKVYNIKGLCRYIEKSEKPNQPVFVYRNTIKLLTNHYYFGANQVVPIPDKFDFSKEFRPSMWHLNQDDVQKFFNDNTKGIQSFWLVTEENKLDKYDESLNLLESYAKGHYRMETEKYFTKNLKAQYFEIIKD